MKIDFEAIKKEDCREIARRLGLELNRQNKVRCFLHAGDKNPSLQVYADGWKCYGCDEHGDAVDLVARYRGVSNGEAAQWIIDTMGTPQPTPPTPKKSSGSDYGEFEREHIYPGGQLKHVVYRKPNGRKDAPWRHLENGKWVSGRPKELFPVPPLYYCRDELPASIFLLEGEKDCDRLEQNHLAAVSLPDGSGSDWYPEYQPYFSGRSVYIIQDNDDPGKKYAQRMAATLQGIAKSVYVLDLTQAWPEIPEHGDVSDLLDHMGDEDGKAAVLHLVADAKEWVPPVADAGPGGAFGTFGTIGTQWDDPIPFDEVETPPFPVDCLPDPMEAFVEELAESTQTPLEMGGTTGLGILSTAFQRRYTVQVTPDWAEPLATFAVSIAPPGERKSAVLSAMTKPVYRYEFRRREAEEIDLVQNRQEKDLLEKRLEFVKQQAAKAKNREQMEDARAEMLELSAQIAQFKSLHEYKLLVDDITAEKLVDVMNTQEGSITVVSAEGGVFDAMAGRYDKAANFDVYLKGHAGDSISVERIGRKSNYVESPRLSMILTIQPEVLNGLMSNTTFRGRGLCGRFLYALCNSKVGRRKIDTMPVSDITKRRYNDFIEKILSDENGGAVTLSNEADQLRKEYQLCVEQRLGKEWEFMQDWGGKLVGATMRIAALLHLSSFPVEEPINAEVMAAAIRLAEFYGVHAQAVYQIMGADEEQTNAKYVWKKIVESGNESISKRDLWRLCHGKFKKSDDIDPVLQLLVDMNYIKIEDQDTGGRPSKKIIVNPRAKSANSAKRGLSA